MQEFPQAIPVRVQPKKKISQSILNEVKMIRGYVQFAFWMWLLGTIWIIWQVFKYRQFIGR